MFSFVLVMVEIFEFCGPCSILCLQCVNLLNCSEKGPHNMCAWTCCKRQLGGTHSSYVLKFGIFVISLQQAVVLVRVTLSLLIGAILMSKLKMFFHYLVVFFSRW